MWTTKKPNCVFLKSHTHNYSVFMVCQLTLWGTGHRQRRTVIPKVRGTNEMSPHGSWQREQEPSGAQQARWTGDRWRLRTAAHICGEYRGGSRAEQSSGNLHRDHQFLAEHGKIITTAPEWFLEAFFGRFWFLISGWNCWEGWIPAKWGSLRSLNSHLSWELSHVQRARERSPADWHGRELVCLWSGAQCRGVRG